MSGGIPDIAGLGYLPLRHEQENVDVGLRHVVNAVAVQKIDPADPQVLREVDGSAGDALGAFFWLPEGGKRNGAGWAFSSWPAKVTRPERGQAISLTTNRGDGQKVRPVRDETLVADERFEEKGPAFPEWANRQPKGWPGLVTGATSENRQQLVWTPGAHGLVAAEAAGDPDLSSVVLDLDGDDRPDKDRRAHLNAFWRVVKKPSTSPTIGTASGLAWQLGSGRGSRAGFGLVTGAGVAQKGGGGPAPTGGDGRIDTGVGFDGTSEQPGPGASATGNPNVPWTIGSVSGGIGSDTRQEPPAAAGGTRHACMSVFAGGPIAIPGPDDTQHQLGADADGNPIMAAAIHAAALYMGPEKGQVGPLAFERGPMPALQSGNFLAPVHLRWDPSIPHTWSSDARPGVGMWRWFAESHFYVPPTTTPPPTTPPPETTPPPSTTPPPTTPRKKRKIPPPPPPSTTPPPTTPGGGDGGTPVITTPRRPGTPEPPAGGGAVTPPGDGGTPVVPGGQVTPPGGGGRDRPENPPPRPPGTPSGSIDEPTGLPPQLPRGTPGGQLEPTPVRPGDLPHPVRPGEPIDPSLPGGGWIDPAGELDATPPEYDPRRDGPLTPDGIPKKRVVAATARDDVSVPFVASTMELAIPALLFRPGTCTAGRPDLTNALRPAEGDLAEHDRTAPVVARVEAAFAKPGANCGSSLPSYTAKPGAARYCGGTASGNVGWFPPEVGMRDHATSFAPAGIDVSTVHHTYLKGKVLHGSGLPDPTGGGTKSGYTWGANATNGAMEFHERSSTGAITSTSTLPKRTGTVIQAPSALTANKLPSADANGDMIDSGVMDDGSAVGLSRQLLNGNHASGLIVEAQANSASLTLRGAHGKTSAGGAVLINGGDPAVGNPNAGSVTVRGGDAPGAGTGGSYTTRAGTSASGAKGVWDLQTPGGTSRLKVNADGSVTTAGDWEHGGSHSYASATVTGLPLPQGHLSGLRVRYSSATAIVVEAGEARSAADDADISLGSETTVSITTIDAAAGLDEKTLSATATTHGTATFEPSASIWSETALSATVRNLTGTNLSGAGTTITGTGTKFLSELAPGDVLRSVSKGAARVTAIASDTSLTIAAAFPGGNPNGDAGTNTVYENLIVRIAAETPRRVNTISHAGTSVVCASAWTSSTTGVAIKIGGEIASAIYHAHLVTGGSGTTAILSTQRTTPYGVTGYTTASRRLGAMPNNSSGNLIPSKTLQVGRWRLLQFSDPDTHSRILAGGTATSATDVDASAVVPSGAIGMMRFIAVYGGTARTIYFRANADGGTYGTFVVDSASAGTISGYGWLGCVGGAYEYYLSGAGSSAFIDVQGFVEEV